MSICLYKCLYTLVRNCEVQYYQYKVDLVTKSSSGIGVETALTLSFSCCIYGE